MQHTRLHKKLTQLILALNSFWLVRNRLRHFGSCAIMPTKYVLQLFGGFMAYCKGEINKNVKMKQPEPKIASGHTERQMSEEISRLLVIEMS